MWTLVETHSLIAVENDMIKPQSMKVLPGVFKVGIN